MKGALLSLAMTGILLWAQAGYCEDEDAVPSVAEKTIDMEAQGGFFPFYWDAKEGKLWLEIGRWDAEFLYVNSLSAGLGSNDIGLDRGQLGSTRVVRFERVGPKVLLVQSNYRYRATTDNPDERAAVADAFAESIIWGFTVAAEEEDRVLVDATDFFLRDAHGVAATLKRGDQGEFELDASRSALYLPRTKNFERNTEVEATLTFTGDSPGRFVRQIAPDAGSITVRQHHSFVELPDDDYSPRAFDPRAGVFSIVYSDYAAPIDEPLEKRIVVRHRLKKRDPSAKVSDAVEPIVYYLDRGTPEPIRSALLEGASWWNQAFEAAGYRDAFRVEMLPDGADPMDLNFNVINWVHRATRGWSYGSSVVDPRTGEIIKGHVTLGSLRVRQDFLIAQGLLAPYETGSGDVAPLKEMALARLRQLSAHEVGHTLGFAHNFASSPSDRASVMDYPHPLLGIADDGSIDLSKAYAVGIGAWDMITVRYAYEDFPQGVDEGEALDAIVRSALDAGLMFISDQDARPPGGAHPQAHLWDNGSDAIEELIHLLDLRAEALGRFGEANLAPGQPLSALEEVLTPLYLLHRYQVEAVAKLIGGLHYTYAVRGDGQVATKLVDPEVQREALGALLAVLDADTLTLPESIIKSIPPRAHGFARHREVFDIRSGLTLDPVTMAEAAADQAVSLILHPERAARLIEHHARRKVQPSLAEVIDTLVRQTWQATQGMNLHGEVHRAVNHVVLARLMALAADENAPAQVRAVATKSLSKLALWLRGGEAKSRKRRAEIAAHFDYALGQLGRFKEDPAAFAIPPLRDLPPGSPIGAGWEDLCVANTGPYSF